VKLVRATFSRLAVGVQWHCHPFGKPFYSIEKRKDLRTKNNAVRKREDVRTDRKTDGCGEKRQTQKQKER